MQTVTNLLVAIPSYAVPRVGRIHLTGLEKLAGTSSGREDSDSQIPRVCHNPRNRNLEFGVPQLLVGNKLHLEGELRMPRF